MSVLGQLTELQAHVCLKILVIGGGISGLAVAYALKSVGHDVTIITKRDRKCQSMGITQSPPNMTRILYRWGLKSFLDQTAEKTRSLTVRDGSQERLIGIMHFDEVFLRDQLAEYLSLRTQALADILQQLVDNEQIQLVPATIVDIQTASNTLATVKTDDEKIFDADFVVCADGYDSSFKHIVTGVEVDHDSSVPKAHLAITFVLPIEVVHQDESLKEITDSPGKWNVWSGSGYILHTNICDGGKFLSATMTSNYSRDVLSIDQIWDDRPLEYWGIDLELFEPRTRRLMSLAKSVFSRVFIARTILDDLVCKNSKVVLVGDAAHPILPGGNQHIGLAIEEAETLKCIFSRIQHRDQIPYFLAAYEEIRQPRTAYIIEYESSMHTALKMPDGPEKDQVKAKFMQVMATGDWDHMDEEGFRSIFGEELIQYSHDATEQVEDWWTKWGKIVAEKVAESAQPKEVIWDTGGFCRRKPSLCQHSLL